MKLSKHVCHPWNGRIDDIPKDVPCSLFSNHRLNLLHRQFWEEGNQGGQEGLEGQRDAEEEQRHADLLQPAEWDRNNQSYNVVWIINWSFILCIEIVSRLKSSFFKIKISDHWYFYYITFDTELWNMTITAIKSILWLKLVL